MQKISLLIQKALLCAFFFLTACSPCTNWQYERINSCEPCFRSAKIFYEPNNKFCQPGIEISYSTQTEFHIFLNIYGCPLPQTLIRDDTIEVFITIDGENSSFIANICQGNQRILIPNQYTQMIIQSLLNNRELCVRVGSYCLTVSPDGFEKYYSKLVKL